LTIGGAVTHGDSAQNSYRAAGRQRRKTKEKTMKQRRLINLKRAV